MRLVRLDHSLSRTPVAWLACHRGAFLVSVANAVLPRGIAHVTRDGIGPAVIGAAEQLQSNLASTWSTSSAYRHR
jgi:hypothetical protein